MRWTLFILFCLLGTPAHAVAIPGVTTGTSTSQQAAPEPSPEQKKAAYAALADVLENEASRNELIAQLREASTTPPT
ncbi:mechanosensitive channel protein, partial [Salmonella enterica]|nr:mechanosensitive channel protein [Salmonella enterica]